MLLSIILIALTFFCLIIASYADLKTREVPDWLNYGLIFAALGIRGIFALEFGSAIFLGGLLGLAVTFGLANLFYHTSQWGGGDSKLLMAMGAVIGINYPLSGASFNLLWFFMVLLFVGAIYGMLWMGFLAIKQRFIFAPSFIISLYKFKKTHFIVGAFSLTLLAASIIIPYFLAAALIILLMFYLLVFVNTVEKNCFVKQVKISHLTEGDWLAKSVSIKGKIILRKKTLGKSDLAKLGEFKKKNLLHAVFIKEGIPFIPSFLFAYIVLIFGKDWIIGLIARLF